MESHFRKETPWTSMMKAKDFGPTARQHEARITSRILERTASGAEVSPSQQLQLVKGKTSHAAANANAGGVNPMEDMQSWLKANLPQAQVYVNVNYSIKNSSVVFEPAGNNSSSQQSQDTHLASSKSAASSSAAAAALDPPGQGSHQGPLRSILSGKKLAASEVHGTPSNTVKNSKRVHIHARKDSPFEVWVPPTALKKQKVGPSPQEQMASQSQPINASTDRKRSNMNMYHQSVAINHLNHGSGQDIRQTYHTLSMMQQEITSCPSGPSTSTGSLSEAMSSVVRQRALQGSMKTSTHQSPIMPRAKSIQKANIHMQQNFAKYLMPQGMQQHQQAPQLLSKPQIDSKLTHGTVKRCSCKRTKCLKLYCPCFADGLFCNAKCNCSDCFNDQSSIAQVHEAREAIKNKNPDAFKPKVRLSRTTKAFSSTPHTQGGMAPIENSAPATLQHQRGCRCSRTRCLKRYCECFAANVFCGSKCSCSNCLNNEESFHMMMTKRSNFMSL